MAKEKNLIQGNISSELKKIFDTQLDDEGMSIGRVVEAMVRLWVELPPHIQRMFYSRNTDNGSLKAMIEEIVDQKMSAASNPDFSKTKTAELELENKRLKAELVQLKKSGPHSPAAIAERESEASHAIRKGPRLKNTGDKSA